MIVKRPRTPRAEGARRPARTIVKRQPVIGSYRPEASRRGGGGVRPPRDNDGGGREWGWQLPRHWPLAVAGFAMLAIVAGALAFGWFSPYFHVNEIEVVGTQRLSPDTIVEKADLLGENMFTADLGAAQNRIYSIPLIATTRIERQWPARIRIVVEERHAWGMWEQAGVRYAIDRDGFVLGTMPAPAGSPVVKSSANTSLLQGERVNYQAVDAAAEIYDRLPRQLGTTVAEVAFTAGQGVKVTTAAGETALLGDSSSIAYKLAAWAAMATEAKKQNITYTTIDLRYGNRPVLQ